MGLKEDAEVAHAGRRSRKRCDVQKAIEELGEDDAAELLALIAEKVVPASIIQDVLAARDPPVILRAFTINRHRNGRCLGCRESQR